jgi:hypothetical protein
MNCTGCKHSNAKTHLSFDTTTMCVKKRRGTPCLYCYVEHSRDHGYNAKRYIEKDTYDGWVQRLRPQTIKRLNKMGGIRTFAFGDYLKTHEKEIRKFLDDCQLCRLKVKVITKIVKFVYDFHDHPAIGIINLSVDNLSNTNKRSPISLELARDLRVNYFKCAIRAVVLNDVDLEYFGADEDIDVITLNHGQNGFKQFSKKEVKAAVKKYPTRVCCEFDTCDGCKTLCGFPGKRRQQIELNAAVESK